MYYIYTLSVKRKNIEDRQQPRFGHLFISGAKPGGQFMSQSHDMRSSFEIHPVPNPSFLLVISYLRCIPLHGW